MGKRNVLNDSRGTIAKSRLKDSLKDILCVLHQIK